MESAELQDSLPSKNVIDVAVDMAPKDKPAAAPQLPAPAPEKQLKPTAKANGVPLEDFLSKGWTEKQMIDGGYAEYVEAAPAVPDAPTVPDAPPPAPKPEPKKVMTAAAGGIAYEAYVKQGWSDQQLIDNNLMEIK